MRNLNVLPALGLLVIAGAVGAADVGGFGITGNVGLGYQYSNINANDPSKATEYRDLSSGVLGTFDIKGRGTDYYLNAFGENLGRDDQYIDFNGGKYGDFKYRVYNNDLRHNIASGSGALTPYFGVGTVNLTTPINATGIINKSPSTWNAFDAGYKRQDIGAMFEVSAKSPFYLRFDGNQVNRNGVKDLAGAQGSSPGQGFIDLPAPINYRTNNYSLEAGYQAKNGHVALTAMRSQFTNNDQVLNWTNGFFRGTDTTVLAPNNDVSKVALNGNLRQLPANSVLAGRMTYSKTTDNVGMLPNMLAAAVGVTNATNASSAGFAGEIVNKTMSLSLNSQPMRGVDTKVYWNWSRKDNNSTQMTFTPVAGSNLQCSGGPCTTELFNYKKYNLGADVGYRFNPENRVVAGFDYLDADRERIDFIHNIDRKYSLEWKNSAFDTLDTKAKYQYLTRSSNFVQTGNFDQFQRRFDLQNVNQNLAKLAFDWTPRQHLDYGLEILYKDNDYTGDRQFLQRTKDKREEIYGSIGFGDPKSFRMLMFVDAELIQYESLHRVGAVPASGDPDAAPAGGPPNTSYTWSAKNRDHAYQVGLGADWLPNERWIVKSSAIWSKTNGSADFAAQAGTILQSPGLLGITNFDNSYKTSFNLKGTYKYTKNWDLSAGYAYERYRISDIGTDNYGYIAASTPTTQNSYASGLNAFNNYTMNILYMMVNYKFD